MKKKKEFVCKMMEFVDKNCHKIIKPSFDVTTDVNLEFEFYKGRSVCHFPEPFKSVMFTFSKPGLFEMVDVMCFSEGGKHDIYIYDVKFLKLSPFGTKVKRFMKKYEKLYQEQEWIGSEVALKDFFAGSTFCPDWVSKPGETIVDCLEEKGKEIKDLSKHLNRSEVFVNQLIEAEIYISPLIAIGLGTFFGTSASFWYAREFHYRETLKRLREKDGNSD